MYQGRREAHPARSRGCVAPRLLRHWPWAFHWLGSILVALVVVAEWRAWYLLVTVQSGREASVPLAGAALGRS